MLKLFSVPRHLLPIDFAPDEFGETEVCDFDMTLAAHENICSLDIAMEDMCGRMQIIESLENLTNQVLHHGRSKSNLCTINNAVHVKLVVIKDEIARMPFEEDFADANDISCW